jgi:parallel beta-helix repeat protein
MKLLFGIALLIGVLVGRSSFAATFYVATTGSDSNSCIDAQNSSTPKRNIIGESGGLSCLEAGNGDILDVRSGTYSDGIRSVVSGTSFANAANIRAHTGETVTLMGGIALEGPSYVIFDGLTFRPQGGSGGIWVGSTFEDGSNSGHHIKFLNFTVDGTNASDCESLAVINRWAHHVEIIGGEWRNIPIGACPEGNKDVYAIYMNGSDNLIERNVFHDNASYAVHIYCGSCTFYRNVVRFNEFYNNGSSNLLSSSALLLGGGDSNQAYDNIVRDNYRDGITSSGATNSKIYNNTVYNNNRSGRAYGGIVWGTGSGTIIKNNIVYNNGSADLADSHGVQTPTFANNHCTNAGTGCAQSGDPLFADPATDDFTLLIGSPAKGAGTPNIDANISWPFVPDIGTMLDVQP